MPVSRVVLTPVSWIWAGVTARRIARATPADVGVPVICVGNLTMGGAGKTPVVRALAERLPAPGPGGAPPSPPAPGGPPRRPPPRHDPPPPAPPARHRAAAA